MIPLTIYLTEEEHQLLSEVVHDHNAEAAIDHAREGAPPPKPQTPASWVVDVLRDALGLEPLGLPRDPPTCAGCGVVVDPTAGLCVPCGLALVEANARLPRT